MISSVAAVISSARARAVRARCQSRCQSASSASHAAHDTRRVVVGAERVAELAEQRLGGGEPSLADEQVESAEVDGEGEVRVDASGEHAGADGVGVGPSPERQQRQRQLAGRQGGIGSVQPQSLQVGEPAIGELDRLGGAAGEPVGLDEVVPRRADPLGVVALHGEVERLVQPAEPVVEVAEVTLQRSEDVQRVAHLGAPFGLAGGRQARRGQGPGRRGSAARGPPGRRRRTAG